jgi:integrase
VIPLSVPEPTGALPRKRIAPNLYERGDRYFLIRRIDGRQVVKALRARNRTEAKKECAHELSELIGAGLTAVGDRSVTFGQLVELFLAHEEGPSRRLGPRTLELRRSLLRLHVVPTLGDKTRATDLTAAHLRRMIDRLRGKKLSGSSIRSCVSSASSVLDHGVRNGSLPRNVVRDLVRGDLPSAKRASEPRYLGEGEIERLLGKLSDEFRPVAAACYFGALRVSEALALRWKDVDFSDKRISVPGTKTAASAQEVPLLPRLETELRTHRERLLKRGFQTVAPSSLVFQTITGLSPGRRNVHRAVSTAAVRADLVPDGAEHVGVHDLRHSFAAYAFAQGLTAVQVARFMRHANPSVTLAVYAGLSRDAFEELGEKLAKMGNEP